MSEPTASLAGLYETDFALWSSTQAKALLDKRFADLDLPHLAEEIGALARTDRLQIRSRVSTLAMHLLKVEYQPSRRSPSWRGTIFEQARRIRLLLEDSPSLQPVLRDSVERAYADARKRASLETGLALETFPEEPTVTFMRALNLALLGDLDLGF